MGKTWPSLGKCEPWMMIHSRSGVGWAWPRHSMITRLPATAIVSTGRIVNVGVVLLVGGARGREGERRVCVLQRCVK